MTQWSWRRRGGYLQLGRRGAELLFRVLTDREEPIRRRDREQRTVLGLDHDLRVIEVVCRDVVEHRRRVERRDNDLPGFTLPTWEQVERVSQEYEPRYDDRLIIDSTRPLADTAADALTFINH